MSRNFALTILLAMMLGSATLAVAGHEEGRNSRGHRGDHSMMPGGFGDPDRMLAHMARQLDLDETQSQQIANIVAAAGPEIDALRERGKACRDDIVALDSGEPDYDVKLQNLALEAGEIATSMTLLHGRLKAEINAQLTDEQREQLAAGRDRRRGRSGHHNAERKDAESL